MLELTKWVFTFRAEVLGEKEEWSESIFLFEGIEHYFCSLSSDLFPHSRAVWWTCVFPSYSGNLTSHQWSLSDFYWQNHGSNIKNIL